MTGSEGTRLARVRGRTKGRGSELETGETGRFREWGWLIRVMERGGPSRREAVSSSDVNEFTERIDPLEAFKASFFSFS